jgi:uncharacterized small protein (DUF1192 family)
MKFKNVFLALLVFGVTACDHSGSSETNSEQAVPVTEISNNENPSTPARQTREASSNDASQMSISDMRARISVWQQNIAGMEAQRIDLGKQEASILEKSNENLTGDEWQQLDELLDAQLTLESKILAENRKVTAELKKITAEQEETIDQLAEIKSLLSGDQPDSAK